MAVTLSADLTEIDDCDSITNWTSKETIEADTTSKREGSASIGVQKVSQETSYAQYDYYTGHGNTYLNITGETHIYLWVKTSMLADTKANGGFRLRLTDSAGNYKEWWFGGSDNYYGDFQSYVVYTGTTPNASSGTLIENEIQYITIFFKILGKTLEGVANCWVDILYYGTGLIVKGGTSGDKGTFSQILDADSTPAYGVMCKRTGCFVLQGPITFGDNSGTTDTYFKDVSQILLFEDAMVSSTHYELKAVGNSTGTNSFELGDKSGTAGISGCIIKSVGAKKFKFTATDTNVNVLKVYGCSFLDADTVSLPVDATNKEVLSCNFELCGEITPSTCVMKYCKFISADDNGIQISNTTLKVTDSDFINCPNGTEITLAGIYTFNNLKFSGNTVDVDNTSGGSVTINCTNGSNPSSYTGDTTINNPVDLNIHVEDKDGNNVSGASCYIEKASDHTQLMNELSNANGDATETFNYTVDTAININIRKSSTGTTRYNPITTTGTITSSGYTLTAVLYKDEIVIP